jgi:predicted O-methyltransferase YrrM
MNKWFSRPFNGQVSRHKQIQQIAGQIKPNVAIETGTFLGTTTPYLATMVSGNTYTIEFLAKYAKKARMRFESEFQSLAITLIEGNSVNEIQKLLETIPPSSVVLAYLDAHWERELPTAQELNELLLWGDNWVAVIDDFKVPGDDSYGFDQYGELVVDQSLIPNGVRLMVPNQSAKSESGARKGTGYVFGPAYKNTNLAEDFRDLREVL